MSELTDRGKAFRAAIAGFIGNKLKKAPKGADGDYAPADATECQTWLLNAVANIGNASIATHPVRLTHSSISGATSIYVEPGQLPQREEVGTHGVPHEFAVDFAIGNSPQVPACQLLQHRDADDKSFASWLVEGDSDLVAELITSAGGDTSVVDMLINALKPTTCTISHALAKQVYWLEGDAPQDDGQYHLLQPITSSTLEDVLHEPISGAKDAYFKARGTQKKAPTFACHSTYPRLVRRNIGGANPQNVSPLNSSRRGNNYLLSSLPPSAWKSSEFANLLKLDSILGSKNSVLLYFGEVRSLTHDLADFLKTNPEANEDTRNRVRKLTQAIASSLVDFGVAVRGRCQPGWTRDPGCSFPLYEKLWLDPERRDLPVRDDPEHPHWNDDDVGFNDAYDRGDWVDEVAVRFGRWLNQQLRDRSDKLAMLGEAEMRYFAKMLIRDTAWPFLDQQNAKAGVA